ncbi:MAG: cytochrome c [Sutterellaceae bacterium]|nr:cytochrome c [Burkholderiaceae bacterium]MCX7900771.1 cytochrome c [Burkholderiaceae bacterium]MDW8429149.1 cytochrome c [Sutterellaceae bacterium]
MRQAMVVTLVLALGTAGAACAGDIEAGRKLAEAQCAACHGKDGKSPVDPSYPILAGQYPDYLAKALTDYKTGARKNPIMGGIAKPLSKRDIQALAAYYGALPGPLTHNK